MLTRLLLTVASVGPALVTAYALAFAFLGGADNGYENKVYLPYVTRQRGSEGFANNFGVSGANLVNLATGERVFLKGMGYSPFFPGETPIWGAKLPNDDRYRNHLDLVKNMNANSVLVFPQFMPENFFVALDETGLMYAQDIYVNGYTDDLLDEEFQRTTIEHIRQVIAHTYAVGRPGKLVFFSLGNEINAGTIFRTDTRHPDIKSFTGRYVQLTTGTPSEVAIAKLMDAAIAYEYEIFGAKHLYCHTSWTHIGPVANRPDLEVAPESVFYADFGDIVCMNVYTYARGVITSPPGSATKTAYQGYIEDLARISQKPIIITQVGLSTSPVAPNPSIPDFGGNDYQKVKSAYSRVWQDVKTAMGSSKVGGLVWFEFMDEWWKNGDRSSDESAHDDTDPEEWFGVYGVDVSRSLSPKDDIPDVVRTVFSP